ncbi:metallophosphoesterase [Kineosporia babensis]|uniref:Metallophosphoesterase n=1 Tax=Kineosporia babensis TaxID=499548 RepID=A0A9X1N8P9_9ACTN|nr:metallophosphoesterase [Kineosporia babensis]MCD5309620.1 metallophosphoesterase [Kineosporia babensis]
MSESDQPTSGRPNQGGPSPDESAPPAPNPDQRVPDQPGEAAGEASPEPAPKPVPGPTRRRLLRVRRWTVEQMFRRPEHPVRAAVRFIVSLTAALAVAAIAVSVYPYRTTVAKVDIVVSGSVTPEHRGITVDSSLGSLQFRDVTALPIGLHVTPRIDLDAVREATSGGATFTNDFRSQLEDRIPAMVLHFAGAALIGLLIGALIGDLIVDGAISVLANKDPLRAGSRRHRLAATATLVASSTVVALVALTATFGITYRSDWWQRYAVTGLLADIAATPDKLAALDARDAAAADKVRAVLSLQDALTRPPTSTDTPVTAYNVMFISDVHRRDIYNYLQEYIDANDVKLLVNTGDETLVGNTAEMTSSYIDSIRRITATTPMIWIKGNHDSASVARRMAEIPGVTVLDQEVVSAMGLQIYGVGDPRTYGAPGDAGSDDVEVVTRIETEAALSAVENLNRETYFDLLLAHEPIMGDTMATTLGPSVRAIGSGHVHHQNETADLQSSDRDYIRLIEGTTGMGGLLRETGDPMEFSILSVGTNCQYTRIIRYKLADPALPDLTRGETYGNNSAFDVHYFQPQDINAERTCAVEDGIDEAVPASATNLATVQEWSSLQLNDDALATPDEVTPDPVSTADEAGDNAIRDDAGDSTPSEATNPSPSETATP